MGRGRFQKSLAMAKRDAELLEIVAIEVRQRRRINPMLGEQAGVLAEADTLQPLLQVAYAAHSEDNPRARAVTSARATEFGCRRAYLTIPGDGSGSRKQPSVEQHRSYVPKYSAYFLFTSSLARSCSSGSALSSLIAESGVRPGFSLTSGWKERKPPTSLIICWPSREKRK